MAQNSTQALGALQGFQKSMQTPSTFLQNQENSLGIPGMQTNVSGLRQAVTNTTNLLNQVAPSVYGRTGQSLVTNAQATRQIGNEQAPIAQQLGQRQQDYTGAQSDLETALQRAQALSGLDIQGQQQQYSNLQSTYDNLYKREQDALAQKMEQKKLDESIKQAALDRAAKASSSAGLDIGSLLGSGKSATATATAQTKASGLTAATLSGGKSKQDAYNAIQQLTSNSNKNLVYDTVNAIAKSAKNGNTYDKYKLQLLAQLGF